MNKRNIPDPTYMDEYEDQKGLENERMQAEEVEVYQQSYNMPEQNRITFILHRHKQIFFF